MKPARYRHQQGNPNCGCPSCVKNICSCKYMASYDMDERILIPTNGGSLYWSNSSPPQYLHRIACTFDVTIEGFSSKTIEQSWYQDIEDINGVYTSNIKEHCEERDLISHPCLFDCSIIYLPLCTINDTNADFTSLHSFLVAGLDDPEVLTDSTVYPNGRGATTYYYNDYKESEGRPQLYVWAITVLYFNERDCACQSPYYFKTKLAEFNGDYYINSIGTPSIEIPESTDCGTKFYHGDLNGQFLTYTVREDDLWIYDGSPVNYIRGLTSRNVPRIGNFGTIEIKYRTAFEPYNLSSADSVCNEEYPDGISSVGSTLYSSYPKYLSATLGSVYSINPLPAESGNKLACDSCSDFNTEYRLFYDDIENRYWTTDPGHAHTVGIYTSTLPEVCSCACILNNTGLYYSGICPTLLNVFVDYEYNGDKTQYSHIIYGEILGDYRTPLGTYVSNGLVARYSYHVNDWRNLPTLDGEGNVINYTPLDYGPTFQLSYEETTSSLLYPPPSGPCLFEESYLLVDFGECENVACVDRDEICPYCHDRLGPNNIIVEIPNGWVDNPVFNYSTGEYELCDEETKQLLGYPDSIVVEPSIMSYITDRMTYKECPGGFIIQNLYNECGWCYSEDIDFGGSYYDNSCLEIWSVPCCIFPTINIALYKYCEDFSISDTLYRTPINPADITLATKNKFVIFAEIVSYSYTYFNGNGASYIGSLLFAAIIDPADYGIDIHCDPHKTCGGTCDTTDVSIVGGQYLDCRFNDLELSFVCHLSNDDWYTPSWDRWRFPIKWNGSSLHITSLYT